jgi:hypothetical protein
VAKYGATYENGIAFFDDLAERIAAATPPRYAASVLGGFDVTVAALAVLRGCAVAAKASAIAERSIPRILTELRDPIERNSAVPAIYALSYLNTVRCCSGPLPAEADDAEQRWLEQLAARSSELTEPERHTMALAACAAARPTLVPAFADLRALPDSFAPEQAFGFDVPGFVGYVAAGIDRGATYQDVEPAWLDFVHRFPYKLDTRSLGWPALLFAARAVYSTIGGLPEGEVADELHRLVTGA